MCKTASKAPTDNGQQTIEGRQTQFFKPLADPPGDRGGSKGGVFSEPEVTLKIATANLTKKKIEAP